MNHMRPCHHHLRIAAGLLLAAAGLNGSALTDLYTDLKNIFEDNHMGFSATYRREATTSQYFAREGLAYIDLGYGARYFFGNTEPKDFFGYTFNARYNQRMYLGWSYERTLPYPYLDNAFNLLSREDYNARFTIEYNITPRLTMYTNVGREMFSEQLNELSYENRTTEEIWRVIVSGSRHDLYKLELGMRYYSDWGSLSGYLYNSYDFVTREVPGPNGLYQTDLSVFRDYLTASLNGGFVSFRVKPYSYLELSGSMDVSQSMKPVRTYDVVDISYLYYPVQVRYQIADQWDVILETINKFQTETNSRLGGRIGGQTYDAWEVEKYNTRLRYNRLGVGVNRYFRFAGINLGGRLAREYNYTAYLNNDEILPKDQSQLLWEYWDRDLVTDNAEFTFSVRPIMNKVSFDGSLVWKFNGWLRESQTLAFQKTDSFEYRLNAFYKPTKLFEVFMSIYSPALRTEYTYDRSPVSTPGGEMPLTLYEQWTWLRQSSVLNDRASNTAGWRFRYSWGTFEMGAIQTMTSRTYLERDGVLLYELLLHPWRYGDTTVSYYNYYTSFNLTINAQLSIGGYFATIPRFTSGNTGGQVNTYEFNRSIVNVRYEFSPQLYMDGSVQSDRTYLTFTSIADEERSLITAFSDKQSDYLKLAVNLVYRP
jgi:hypothetical protein